MGTVTCRNCKGTGAYYPKSGRRLPCRACNGTGINQSLLSTRCEYDRAEIIYKRGTPAPRYCKECRNRQLEKQCSQSGCSNTIRYKLGWTNIPDYCGPCQKKRSQGWSASWCPGVGFSSCGKIIWSPPGKKFNLCRECNERKRAADAAKWKTKACKGCGCEIRYNVEWSNIPEYCQKCNQWQYKTCAATGCSNQVKYKNYWDNPPNVCPDCKKKRKSRITAGDIYRSGLVPRGWQHAGNVDIIDGHTTMYFPGKGTNGGGYRVSWDGSGSPHWTDEGLPKGHPERHRDPR